MIDTHCHLDAPAFDADRAAVIARAQAAGVTGFLLAGVNPEGWSRQRALVERVPGCARLAGFHPQEAAAFDLAALCAELDRAPRPIGVGEIGLDARLGEETSPAQRHAFRAQLAVARERRLPVSLHVVGAWAPLLAILDQDRLPAAGGVLHACSASAEVVDALVKRGLHIAFGGAATWPKAKKLHRALNATPLHRLLVETDAPDLPPASVTGRNEPASLPGIIQALAALRDQPAPALAAAAEENARRLFGL